MVHYTKDITTAADIAESSRTKTSIKIGHGIIDEVTLYFPLGCAKLAHVVIQQGGHQFAPSTRKQSFSGHGTTIKYNPNFDTTHGTNLIDVYTWNDDEIFEHTITVDINVKTTPKTPKQTDDKTQAFKEKIGSIFEKIGGQTP